MFVTVPEIYMITNHPGEQLVFIIQYVKNNFQSLNEAI